MTKFEKSQSAEAENSAMKVMKIEAAKAVAEKVVDFLIGMRGERSLRMKEQWFKVVDEDGVSVDVCLWSDGSRMFKGMYKADHRAKVITSAGGKVDAKYFDLSEGCFAVRNYLEDLLSNAAEMREAMADVVKEIDLGGENFSRGVWNIDVPNEITRMAAGEDFVFNEDAVVKMN